MLSFKNNFRRRVTISHKQGGLSVRIARRNDRMTSVILLLGFTAGFIFFCSILLPPLFRRPFSDDVYVLPFLGFVILWYVVGLRVSIWRLFGVEQIAVESGIVFWTRTALRWVRKVEIPTTDITQVKAIRPWHSLSNHVQLVARNRRYSIGVMLLQDETTELATQLESAVGRSH